MFMYLLLIWKLLISLSFVVEKLPWWSPKNKSYLIHLSLECLRVWSCIFFLNVLRFGYFFSFRLLERMFSFLYLIFKVGSSAELYINASILIREIIMVRTTQYKKLCLTCIYMNLLKHIEEAHTSPKQISSHLFSTDSRKKIS